MEGINQELPPPLDSEYLEVAWGVEKSGELHKPLWIARPKPQDFDVKFEMLYCGICHSDVHNVKNEWGPCHFPCVAGHELLGRVTEVGSKVTKFKVGDHVGVGCFIDSCLDCPNCKDGDEQYCLKGCTLTYKGDKKHGRVSGNQDTKTMGGYSAANTVHEDFVLKIHPGMDLERTAPILCAGITMYSPLKHWGAAGDKKMVIGVVGIGGLGTMGIKLAKALGNDVLAISTSPSKESMAKERGADYFVSSKDPQGLATYAGKCDLILNTVSADHDFNTYIPLLAKGRGVLVQLGGVTKPHDLYQFPLMMSRLSIAGSLIGGIKETQEVIDLCFKHGVYPDCKVVEAKDIDDCWDQLQSSNADGLRYVIDIKKSLENKDYLP